MKRKLVLFSALLMLAILMNAYVAGAAYEIKAYRENGTEARSLASGKLTFEAEFSGDAGSVSLIVVVYKNDEIVDFAVAQKLPPHTEDQTKLTVQAEIPEDISGCEAVAMLWDGLFTMDALCDDLVLK